MNFKHAKKNIEIRLNKENNEIKERCLRDQIERSFEKVIYFHVNYLKLKQNIFQLAKKTIPKN